MKDKYVFKIFLSDFYQICFQNIPIFVCMFVGPLSRVRPRNGILALGLVVLVVHVLVLVLSLRSEFIGKL